MVRILLSYVITIIAICSSLFEAILVLIYHILLSKYIMYMKSYVNSLNRRETHGGTQRN